jgi:RNA recognition motif-containing protein
MFTNYKNETNIFSRGLKKGVTKEELIEAFSLFGEIQHCEVKDPNNPKYQTIMGFINYANKESALACLMGAQSSEKVRGFFLNEKVYVNLHVPKTQHSSMNIMRNKMQGPNMMQPNDMMRQF